MAEMKYWQAINNALREEMQRDPSVILFGEDVGKAGGPFGASRGLRDEFGALRVRDTPISELGIVGAAVGAAMTGLRPVVEIMFFDFITLAMDQLVNQAAKMRYMSGGEYSVPLVVRTLCGAGRGSGPQHSQNFEAWLAAVPGLRVVCPGTPADARDMLKAAIRCDDPVIVVESSRLWTQRGEVGDSDSLTSLDKGNVVRPGSDITLVSWGWALSRTLEAAAKLAEIGVDAEVIDLRTLAPLDEDLIVASVSRTGRLLIVQDAPGPFGAGAEIAAIAGERAFGALRAPIERLTPPFAPVPFPSHLENHFYPQADAIARAAQRILGGTSG